MITDLNEIVKEWGYRVHNSQPDPKNTTHQYKLYELLIEYGWPINAIDELLHNLNEVDIVKNKDSGNIYTVQTHNPDTQDLITKNASDDEIEKVKKKEKPKKVEVPKTVKSIFDDSQASVQLGLMYLNDDEKKLFGEFKNDFQKLMKNPSEELAKQMVDKYGLEVSSGAKPKVYIRNINFEARTILGQTKGTVFIKDTLESALGTKLPGVTAGGKGAKQAVATTSKPDLGKDSVIKSEQDSNVKSLFDKEPYDRLKGGFHQLYGPIDKDGKLVYPSNGKNARKYLEHSLNKNQSIKNTINVLKDLEKTDNVSPKVREALEIHQKNMETIVKEYDIPSQEAAEAIGNSYAKMAEDINTESPSLAGAMMKNLAEFVLYDTEVAAGDEVYLPSHPSFPGGDKLKVTRDGNKVERIASVSVKYGRKGKYGQFGFGGECGQYQKYHPNPEYRDILNSRAGDDGYTMAVKDDVIQSDEKMDKLTEESGLGNAIKDKKELNNIFRKFIDDMNQLKKDIDYEQNAAKAKKQGKPPAKKQLELHKERIFKLQKEAAEKMKDVIDREELNKLVGKDNASMMMLRPEAMATSIIFAAQLKTSNGLDVIEHNHQEIKDGVLISKTDTAEDGTIDIKNWKLGFRAYDNRGGGLNASFNSDRKEL